MKCSKCSQTKKCSKLKTAVLNKKESKLFVRYDQVVVAGGCWVDGTASDGIGSEIGAFWDGSIMTA